MSTIAQLEVRETIEQFARTMVARMVAYVSDHYNVPDFEPRVVISFAPTRRWSRGGIRNSIPFVYILCKRHLIPCTTGYTMDFLEYKHIANDPVIGAVKDVPWKTALACLIAHEVAHAVQFFPKTKESAKEMLGIAELDDRNSMLEKHDWFWQRIYADLRTQFVNGKDLEEVATVKATPSPRLINKGWRSVSQKHGKYRYSWYYNTQNEELIGVLCAAGNSIWRFNPTTKEFKLLNVKNLAEARKSEFGI